MNFNIADIDNFIRSYIINTIKQRYQNIDTSDNSAFDDLFVKPVSELFKGPLDVLTSLEFKMNLGNAPDMSEADLDEIGSNNYFMDRGAGDFATGSLTLSFSRIPTTTNLIIPVGTTFQTASGLQFQTTQKYEFTPAELTTKYNSSKGTYDVTITVSALDIGSKYNVNAGEINQAVTDIPNLSSVTNGATLVGGTDKESNADYASRIKEFYISRHLGTKPGYRQYILANYPKVTDLFVVGYEDPEMQRDLVTILRNGNPLDIHIGGKVDIYLEGTETASETVDITINSPKIALKQPGADIDLTTLNVSNSTLPNNVVTYTTNLDTEANVMYVQITNASNVSYDPNAINNIRITYGYNVGEVLTPTEEGAVIGPSNTAEIAKAPLVAVSKIYDKASPTVVPIATANIIRERKDGTPILDSTDTYYGSSHEYSKISITNVDGVVNGATYTAEYVYGKTIYDIKTDLDVLENRIITTDILVKEATPVLINIRIAIRLKQGQMMDESKQSIVNNSIKNYFSSLRMGATVEESDILGWIFKDTTINFIEFIALPFKAFYVPDNASDAISDEREGTTISTTRLQYPQLNKSDVIEYA